MKIEKQPTRNADKADLERAVAETERGYSVPGCCQISRNGVVVAVVSGVGQNHCRSLARRMAGRGSWKPGDC